MFAMGIPGIPAAAACAGATRGVPIADETRVISDAVVQLGGTDSLPIRVALPVLAVTFPKRVAPDSAPPSMPASAAAAAAPSPIATAPSPAAAATSPPATNPVHV